MRSLPTTKQSISAGVGLALLWSYWPVLAEIVDRWTTDPKYSHGYLVPVFSAWLLWSRLGKKKESEKRDLFSGNWWGLVLLVPGFGLHLAGAYLYFDTLSEVSLLFSLAGLCVCVGGMKLLRIAGPSIAFLAFMLPLPYRVETALGQPLQHVATVASVYLLQMMGFCAFAEGNIVVLNSTNLGVVEACSGLGMLVTFFAVTAAVAIVLRRPWLDRVVVLLSAIPVALAANIIRITATGVLGELVGGAKAHVFFHDVAGLLMTPLALILIWIELKLLSRLLVEVPEATPEGIGLGLGAGPVRAPAKRDKKVAVHG